MPWLCTCRGRFYNEHNDWPQFHEQQQVGWVSNISRGLREYDAYKHLVHDSFGGMPLLPFQDSIDFATVHRYGSTDFAATALSTLPGLQRQWKKPVFWGETALSANASVDATKWWAEDSQNVHLHNALWASAVSMAAGGAMHWWWHEFDDHNAYREFAPVRKFTDMLPLLDRTWSHHPVLQSNGTLPRRSCALPAHPNSHFPVSEGHALANSEGGDPARCQQLCCQNTACDGWIFAQRQVISAGRNCTLGQPCCWLKAGVASIAPLANCTAGFMHTSMQPGNWQVTGGALVGASRDHNDTAGIWLKNVAYTWQKQDSAAANQLVGPVHIQLPGFVANSKFTISMIDTSTGDVTSTQSATAGAHGLLLVFEPFRRDVAAIIK
eukprot:COSAG01_NODE_516_length_16026_cov_63.502857_10_plen_381_part_00